MRVLMYVPFLPSHLKAAIAQQVDTLRDRVARNSGSFRLLARGLDGAIPLPDRPTAKHAAFVQGHPDDFRFLIDEACRADVVYCPYPFGVLPPDVRAVVPASVVFAVGPLFFDHSELGHTTDRYRREFRRVIATATALVFANEDDRRAALTYGAMPEQCHIAHTDTLDQTLMGATSRTVLRQAATHSKEQRIAWILTHTTLREAEVKLLRELGYEVWTTKQVHRHPDFRSGAGDPAWDDGLSLPTEVLATLNTHNFYEDPFTPEVAAVLNGYFGTVMLDPYPEKLFELLKHYQGRILIRAFGREHPLTYSEYLDHPDLPHIRERMRLYSERVWFTPCYESILPVEDDFLRSRAELLPVALPDRVMRSRDTWVGGDRRIFFVCPSIRTAPAYYGVIYKRFKREYGRFAHLITGHQGIPVKDPNVAGFVSDEEMRRLFREMQVMYYHSREPRHIHYHPLEAIVHGMPVIYMRGGLMEAFDTGSQAGACDNDDEARNKLRRVLDGDEALIQAVRESQQTILDTFLPHNVKAVWQQAFIGRIMGEALQRELPSPALCLPWVKRFAPALSALPDDLNQLPPLLPTATMINAAWKRPMTNDEIRAGTDIEKPAKGLFGKAARIGYMAWKVLSLYAHAAWEQGTWRPRKTKMRPYLPYAVRYWFPSLTLECRTGQEPLLDEIVPLRSDPLSLDALPRTPAYVIDPIGWLDPRQTDVPSLPLTVIYSRLPGEEDDSFDKLTPSLMAEARLWTTMARQVVFACEEDRRAAVRRYGIDPNKTTVVPGGLVYGPIPEPEPVESLPSRYWLACGGPLRRENVPLMQKTLEMLQRRGTDIPAVVWSAFPQSYPERHITTGVQAVTLSDAQFQTAARGAEWVIVNARSGAEATRRVFHAALARVPVVAVDSPAVRAQWSEAEVRLVPPDDPVALADAIAAGADAARIDRAYRKAVDASRRAA